VRTLRFFSVTHLVSCWQYYCIFRFLSLCLPENLSWTFSVFLVRRTLYLFLILLFYVLYLFFLFCDRFLCCTLLFRATGYAILFPQWETPLRFLFPTIGENKELACDWIPCACEILQKKREESLGKFCDFDDIFMFTIKQFH